MGRAIRAAHVHTQSYVHQTCFHTKRHPFLFINYSSYKPPRHHSPPLPSMQQQLHNTTHNTTHPIMMTCSLLPTHWALLPVCNTHLKLSTPTHCTHLKHSTHQAHHQAHHQQGCQTPQLVVLQSKIVAEMQARATTPHLGLTQHTLHTIPQVPHHCIQTPCIAPNTTIPLHGSRHPCPHVKIWRWL